MKLDDLIEEFRKHPTTREGVKRIVEALAPDDDEIAAYNRLSYKVREQLKCECDYLPEDRCIRCSVMEALKCLETRFNDILGDAGNEKAAGAAALEVAGAGLSPASGQAPAADICPRCGYPAQDQCDSPDCNKTAADPSPEVCEWTIDGRNLWFAWCDKQMGHRSYPQTPTHCPSCGKPIAFKEPTP